MNGITAWQMLFREAEVKAGQTILVHGANGGVGTVICQLARRFGIRVIGMASPRHHYALRKMGVAQWTTTLPIYPNAFGSLRLTVWTQPSIT